MGEARMLQTLIKNWLLVLSGVLQALFAVVNLLMQHPDAVTFRKFVMENTTVPLLWERPRPGRRTRMPRITVKGRMGLIFTVALVVIILIALPAARWFLAVSVVLGVVVALILRLTRREWVVADTRVVSVRLPQGIVLTRAPEYRDSGAPSTNVSARVSAPAFGERGSRIPPSLLLILGGSKDL
jgi:hypothetical protein